MKPRIRPATPADIPAMQALAERSATAAHWSIAQYQEIFEPAGSSRVPVSGVASASVAVVSAGRRDAYRTAGGTPALRPSRASLGGRRDAYRTAGETPALRPSHASLGGRRDAYGTAGGTPALRPLRASLGRRRDAYGTAGEPPALRPSRLAWVIEDRSGVQGFLVARVLGREWELENIVVADRVQRRGRATSLLGVLVKLAKSQGASWIFLEVRESNRAARALYQKNAFSEAGRRNRYYRDPVEAAILYRVDLG